jgi:hypothetical protein
MARSRGGYARSEPLPSPAPAQALPLATASCPSIRGAFLRTILLWRNASPIDLVIAQQAPIVAPITWRAMEIQTSDAPFGSSSEPCNRRVVCGERLAR